MMPHEYFVEDVSKSNNEWKICRSSDLHFSVETFDTQSLALEARASGKFTILEY
jgi:hypothetical protein